MGRRPGGVVISTTRGSWRSDVVNVAVPYSALPVRATKRRLRLIANDALVYSFVLIDRCPRSDVVDIAAWLTIVSLQGDCEVQVLMQNYFMSNVRREKLPRHENTS